MSCHFLLLYLDKTKVILLVPKNLRYILTGHIAGLALATSAVRNLGVIIDQGFSFM